MKKSNINEIEAYTKLLMKCVSDDEYFDEGLVNYLLNYNPEIIEKENFKKTLTGLVVCSDLWGYIKTSTSEETQKKWGDILNKNIEEEGKFLYSKFNFHDQDKRSKRVNYDPLFNKIKEKYHRVSESFINLVTNSYKIGDIELNGNNFKEIELELIINDLLNDNNLNHVRFDKQKSLIKVLQKYIVNNFEELNIKSMKDKNKNFLRLLSLGNNAINYIFQTIEKKERDELISNYGLEEKILTYMRYKSISRDYFVDMLYSYKNKEFWLKDLKCYNKEKNEFYIKESIKDIIEISDTLNFLYKDISKFNQYTTKINYEYVEESYGSKNEKIMRVIKFFKEELKNASNYKEEIEKLMILAIWNESSELYELVKEIRKDEKGDIEDMKLNHPLLKQVSSIKNEFLLKMKKEESAELKKKLEGKLMEKEDYPLKRKKI